MNGFVVAYGFQTCSAESPSQEKRLSKLPTDASKEAERVHVGASLKVGESPLRKRLRRCCRGTTGEVRKPHLTAPIAEML